MRVSLSRPCRHEQLGFTLLELVIAMTLLALIMTMLFSGLRLATRAWDSGETRTEAVNEVQLAQNWIRRQLRQARPIPLETTGREKRIAFAGERQVMHFVAPLPAHRGGGGLYRLTLEVSGVGAKQLVLRYHLFHPDTGGFNPTGEGEALVLAKAVEEAEFAYFGSEDPDLAPRWHARWDGTTHLPHLVRIDLKLPSEAGADWPPLTAAPRVDGASRPWPETAPAASEDRPSPVA